MLVFFYVSTSFSQIKIASWNIKDLGQSKNKGEVEYMANELNQFDIVAIQEVVAGPGGAKAVARLADELNRKGTKWDYTISNPTVSSPYSSERYAYLWKVNKIKINKKAKLDHHYIEEIEREPYMFTFKYRKNNFRLFSFHAVPKSKQPEREIKYFKNYPEHFSEDELLFLGDFNIPNNHTVFNPLRKMNYKPSMSKQKTSLRTKCIANDCLASSYDHIFLNNQKVIILDYGVSHFYRNFDSLKKARKISDHIPIWVEIDLR